MVTATKRQQRGSVLEESRVLAVLLRWEALLDGAGDLALPGNLLAVTLHAQAPERLARDVLQAQQSATEGNE